MKFEPIIGERYNTKDWNSQYKVIMYSEEKEVVTYQTMNWTQHTERLIAFKSKIVK